MFNSDSFNGDILNIPLNLRWLVYQRLQELAISCWCLADGGLRVEVKNPVEVFLVHSTIKQLTASRQELIDWLENCRLG